MRDNTVYERIKVGTADATLGTNNSGGRTGYVIGGDYGNYFFYGDIDEYRDLNGRYNTASGATDDFDIDSGLKKVNIGWTSASVSTVRGGTLALPASIDTIELN